MNRICHVIGAGEICKNDIAQLKNKSTNDLLIAADGGILPLLEGGILPDVLIGDFDSCDEKKLVLPTDIPIRRLNPIKDYTDMHTSIQHGLSQGFRRFFLYGATGGRIDHTIANIQLLSWLASMGCSARMYGTDNQFDVIRDSEIRFSSAKSGFLSVFSLTDESTGVYETGLKYQLENAVLKNTYPLGVSNEFIGEESCIRVGCGTLLVISPR